MSNIQLELPGSERAVLRALVVAVDRQVSALSSHTTVEAYRSAASALAATWAELGKALALGQAAALRECPRCKHLGMRTATRCGYCWAELSPLPPEQGAISDESGTVNGIPQDKQARNGPASPSPL